MGELELVGGNEGHFLDRVFLEKSIRGPVDPIWFAAALSTWPSSDYVSACLTNPAEGKYLASMALLFPVVRNDGTEASYPPVDVMAVRALIASANTDEKDRVLSDAIGRMEVALRVFRDLQSVAEDYPQECEEELEHLLSELVEDRPISG